MKQRGLTHTAVRTGKRVRVELLDGKVIIGKFFDRDCNNIYIDTDSGRVRIRKSSLVRFGSYIKKQK